MRSQIWHFWLSRLFISYERQNITYLLQFTTHLTCFSAISSFSLNFIDVYIWERLLWCFSLIISLSYRPFCEIRSKDGPHFPSFLIKSRIPYAWTRCKAVFPKASQIHFHKLLIHISSSTVKFRRIAPVKPTIYIFQTTILHSSPNTPSATLEQKHGMPSQPLFAMP